jgi:F0F1-type ATP synthase membrane subunit b/b'
VSLLALIGAPHLAPVLRAAAEEASGLQINFFWVIVSSLNFLVFLFLANRAFGGKLGSMLSERRERIAQGLKDAEQARLDRANAENERT